MTSWSQDSYIKAYRFAALAHKDQKFPGTNLPYLMHLSFVSMEIIAALASEGSLHANLAVQCSLLHDTLEDTDTTTEQLEYAFGRAVADGVQALTKNNPAFQGITDNQTRKRAVMDDCLHRIRLQPKEIWMVKLADRISNLLPPPEHWSDETIHVYKDEALEILNILGSASPYLALRLRHKITRYPE